MYKRQLPSYLSNCLFCFEGNVRYASILGYVGAGGLGLILNEKIGWREYSSVGMILVVLFVTVFIIETISRAAPVSYTHLFRVWIISWAARSES